MPFHIEHSGPAPLSTYFLIKPVPPSEDESEGTSLAQRVKARFTSAFRGRRMQGITIDLPEGYSGLIFTTEGADSELPQGKGKAAARLAAHDKRQVHTKGKAKKSKRTTRSSTYDDTNAEEEDMDTNVDGESVADSNDAELIKTLRPTAHFSSFTLWNADVDVDEGRDEYLRFLSEYQQLLAEIHRIDP
ncbi:hypothetical protein K439DRAFT_1408866 [Ramaria rubella]|nr:hypothetical protein K439DRAFT_1408866 [Ramaria rubella]